MIPGMCSAALLHDSASRVPSCTHVTPEGTRQASVPAVGPAEPVQHPGGALSGWVWSLGWSSGAVLGQLSHWDVPQVAVCVQDLQA
jgi:hypothetical protein